MTEHPNPRCGPGGLWWYYDINKNARGPYSTESDALKALLEAIEQQRKWRENVDARKQSKKSD